MAEVLVRSRDPLSLLGGLAALLGGVAWTVKGAVILIAGVQPPWLFEMGPVLFGAGLLGVASSTIQDGHRRNATLSLGAVAVFAAMVSLVIDRDEAFNPGLVASTGALLVGLWMVPRRASWPAPLAWWIGIAMIPALLVGGVLSELNERLIEIPLICLGIAWGTVGASLVRQPAEKTRRV